MSHSFYKCKSKTAWQNVKGQDHLSPSPVLPLERNRSHTTHLTNEGYSKACEAGNLSKSSYWSVSALHGIFEDLSGIRRCHKNQSLITQEKHPCSSSSSKDCVFQLQGIYETLKGQNGTLKFCFQAESAFQSFLLNNTRKVYWTLPGSLILGISKKVGKR